MASRPPAAIHFGFGTLLCILIFFVMAFSLWGDWLWFDSVGFSEVFTTTYATKAVLAIVGFAIAALSFFVVFLVISRKEKMSDGSQLALFALMVSLLLGAWASSQWFSYQTFQNQVPFGKMDPVFGMDLSFFVFTLPFLRFVILYMIVLISVLLLFSVGLSLYVSLRKIQIELSGKQIRQINLTLPPSVRSLAGILFGFLLLLASAWIWTMRFALVFSTRSHFFGAGYVDVMFLLPFYTAVGVLAGVVAILFMVSGWLSTHRIAIAGLAFGVILFLGGHLFAALLQAWYVVPNEFNLEKEYIAQNIEYTSFAYGLDRFRSREFVPVNNLSSRDISQNQETIRNIRLWDWRPLLTTYRQLQLFRTYYSFSDVDIDRYIIGNTTRQLMISPREIDVSQLDQKAQTWVNRRFVYTHGYGAVASPVTTILGEGLPELLMKDIPIETNVSALSVDEPRIYFGELATDYIIVGTNNAEFDYPQGNQNVYTDYGGRDGIVLDSYVKRLIFAAKLSDLNLLLSSALGEKSRLLFRRDIMTRVGSVAPFLIFDDDPYLVIIDKKLYWIMDAYTQTMRIPYSEPSGSLNYVRNSVKVVIDAYDGTMNFYTVEDEPIIATYRSMYPTLFLNKSTIPAGFLSHLRYPEGLFVVQANIYSTYHMKDPQVFYNKEDVWQIPSEIYQQSAVTMEPYYVVSKLPDAKKEGFYLTLPLIPKGKENMIAWMVAHADPENYGQVEVFELSKQTLAYGPMQIEARIDQDTEISQVLTLWGQQGSEVVRGNMMIIPIEKSFLYVEPLYLKASREGALPELKRVIVSYGDRLTMQKSLEEALAVLFGSAPQKAGASTPQMPRNESRVPNHEAARTYELAKEALKRGDFVAYAEYFEKLGELLEK